MDEIMDNFDKEEKSVILEIARVTLMDGDMCEAASLHLDLEWGYLMELKEKIETVSNKD